MIKLRGFFCVTFFSVAFFVASAAISVNGDLSAQGWSKAYGGSARDAAHALIQTSDGGYALAGETFSFGAGNGDMWLLKVDSGGTAQWNATFGGPDGDFAFDAVQTLDGGYALAGITYSFGVDGGSMWLVKTDNNGTMLWNATYGGYGEAFALIQTYDGGYALAGDTGTDMWLVKTDNAGNAQWNTTYGGGAYYDGARGIIQAPDGGYVLCGTTYCFGAGSGDMWLIRTDDEGNIQWNATYGGALEDEAYALVRTLDGGYALAGRTESYGAGSADMWLVKTDVAGNIQWNVTYGDSRYNGASALIQTLDGGFAISGYTGPIGSYQAWLVKADEAGKAQWNVTYSGASVASALIQTSDLGYALAGCTSLYLGDMWLIRTDEYGIVPEFSESSLLLAVVLTFTATIILREGPLRKFSREAHL